MVISYNAKTVEVCLKYCKTYTNKKNIFAL